MYSRRVQSELLPLYSDLHNFEGIFMDWVDSIVTKLGNCTERGSRAVVLFIEYLDVNVGKC